MDEINKPVVNSPTGPIPIFHDLKVYTRFCCAQSLISDKTNDQDTSYFYVFKLRTIVIML